MKPVKIAFWGDSITEGKPGCSFFKHLRCDPNRYILENHGKGGDTVISLYNRLKDHGCDDDYAMIFLLVGVNDILVKLTWWYALMKKMGHQPWSRNAREFETYYAKILALLSGKSKAVIAVSPLFLGEDLNNPWNARLDRQREIILPLTHQFDNVEFMDIHNDSLKPVLTGHQRDNQPIADYLPGSFRRWLHDALLLKHPARVAETTKKRGLYLTMDGVHLNDRGARIVAGALTRRIEKQAAG